MHEYECMKYNIQQKTKLPSMKSIYKDDDDDYSNNDDDEVER